MMSEPKISIAIVTFNAESTLAETLESIISQDYKNYELIVIDGQSNDGTHTIIDKYKEHISVLVIEKDRGIYDAMNKAMDNATGDFIIFLGSDDLLYQKNTLSCVAKKLKQGKINYGRVVRSSDYKSHEGKCNKITLMFRNPCHQCIFYPSRAYKNSHYNIEYKIYGDWDFNLRLFNTYPIHYIKEIIAVFNVTGISNQKTDEKFLKDKDKIVSENYSWPYVYLYWVLKKIRNIKKRIMK